MLLPLGCATEDSGWHSELKTIRFSIEEGNYALSDYWNGLEHRQQPDNLNCPLLVGTYLS
jgi:hypothetical protein